MKRLFTIMLICFSFTSYTKEVDNKLVKRIDHISIYYNTIQEVDSMMYIFSKVLDLPIWLKPGLKEVENSPSIKFYTSGVYLGNVFLEFITFNTETTPNNSEGIKPIRHAFAFSNETSSTDVMLDQIEVQRSRKFHYAFKDESGSVDTLFTNITVRELTNNQILIFFCQYHLKLFDCSSFDFGDLPNLSNPEDQHTFYYNQLRKKDGGRLKIMNVDKIALSSNLYEQHKQTINSLLFPIASSINSVWEIEHGPNLLLTEGKDLLHLESIFLKVESLENAKDYINKENIAFEILENSIELSALSSFLGLNLLIIE